MFFLEIFNYSLKKWLVVLLFKIHRKAVGDVYSRSLLERVPSWIDRALCAALLPGIAGLCVGTKK